jgi:hypothetical protein
MPSQLPHRQWPSPHGWLRRWSSSPASSRRQRRRSRTSPDARVGGINLERDGEPKSGGAPARWSLEIPPASTSCGCGRWLICSLSYGWIIDAIKVSVQAQTHQEFDGVLSDVDGGLQRGLRQVSRWLAAERNDTICLTPGSPQCSAYPGRLPGRGAPPRLLPSAWGDLHQRPGDELRRDTTV